MTDRRIGVCWPLGPRVFLIAGVAVFGVTLIGVRAMLSWPYHEWAATSALFHQRLDLTGPVVAFFGAYLSGRLTPPSRVFAQPRFSREHGQYLLHSLTPAALIVTTAYVLALLPVVVSTTRTATYGSIDLLVVVSGLLGLVAFLVLGWLLGLVARSALIAPVAFALAFGATLAGYSGDTFAALLPVLHISPTLGFHESVSLVVFRIAFMFVLIVVALIAAEGILSHRQYVRERPAAQRAALWLLPVAFAAVALIDKPALFVGDATLPSVCKAAEGIEFCVHEGHRSQLGPLVEAVGPIVAVVGSPSLSFVRVHDKALAGPTERPEDARTFFFDLSPTLRIDDSTAEIAMIAAGGPQCQALLGMNTGDERATNMWMLASRLRGNKQDGLESRFGVLSDPELRAWFDAHRQRVAECTITSDLLP